MFSHTDLTKLAFRWLISQKCVVVTSELALSGGERPDGLGWQTGGETILVEAKASISDMRADAEKIVRLIPDIGLGANRYYVVNKKMEEKALELLPAGWGLLVPRGSGLGVVRPSEVFEHNLMRESRMLISIIRRIAGSERPFSGVGVKCFVHDILLDRETKNVRLSVAPTANADAQLSID